MTVVGSAEIVITPRMAGFAGLGAQAKSELGPVGAAAGDAAAGLNRAEKGAKDFGLGLGAMGSKVAGAAGEIAKLGTLAIGASLVYALVKGATSADKFEAAMTRLNTQAGVSKNQLGVLSTGVLQLAGQVGENPDSLAESLFHIESNFSSLGITAPKALNLVKIASEGARIGNANLVDVTNALTAAVASGIPGVQNFGQAMGILNATVGAGDMTMQDLANAFSTGAVAAVKGYGLSITDVGAALAVFGDNNIRGAAAGTALRVSVQALAVPAKGGSEALKGLGLSSTSLAKDMQNGGLLTAVEDLHAHLVAAGVSATQQGQILTEVFGKKAGTGINILNDQLARLQSKYPDLEKGAGKFGAAWDTAQKTTSQKLADLRGSFDTFLITVGKSTQGVQGKFAEMGAGILSKVTAFVSGAGNTFSSGPLKQGLSDMGRLVTNLGKTFTDLEPAFKNLAMLAGGSFLVALHLTADVFGVIADHGTVLRTLLYVLVGAWTANRIAVTTLAVAEAAGNIVTLIRVASTSGLTAALGANSAATTGNLIGTRLLTTAYNSSLVTLVRTTVAWTANKVAMLATAVASKALAAAQWLINAAMDANPITLVVIALVALGAGIYEAYKHFAPFRDAVNAVGGALKTAGLAIAHFGTSLYNDMTGPITAVKNFVAKWWPYILVTVMTGGIGLAVMAIVKHWSDISGAFMTGITAIKNFAAKWWPYILVTLLTGGLILLAAVIYRNWSSITGFFTAAITTIKNFVVKWWPWILVTVMTGGLGVFAAVVYKNWGTISSTFMSAINVIKNFVVKWWPWIFATMTLGLSLLVSAAIKNWGSISNTFMSVINAIKNFVVRWWPYILVTVMTGGLALFGIAVQRNWSTIEHVFTTSLNAIVSFVVGTIPAMLRAATNLMIGFYTGMWNQLSSLPGWISRTLTSVVLHGIPSLVSSGVNMIEGLLNGMWSVLKDIGSWIRVNVYDNIVGAVKHLFGINSPSTVMAGLGGHLISGLLKGIIFSSGNAGTVLKKALGGLGSIAKDVLSGAFGGELLKDLGGVGGFVKHLGGDVLKSLGGFFGGIFGGGGPSGSNAASAAIVQAMAAAVYGWVGGQWSALQSLLMGESGFNANAVNPSSGAAGIFQSLGHGPVPLGDASAQADWGLNYIATTYGNPENAYAMWLSRSPHWYDTGGGKAWPSGTMGINQSGETEYVWKKSQLAGVGGTHLTINVDARGAVDPAAITATVKAAVAAGGVTLMKQLNDMVTSGVGATA